MPKSHLFERVKAAVIEGITSGRYGIGTVLPAAEVLASKARCSTGTVRRALTELAGEGLVQRVRHRGTVVAKRPSVGRVCLLLSGDAHMNLLLQDAVYAGLVRAGYHVDVVPRSVDLRHALDQCERLLAAPSPSDSLVALEPFPDGDESSGLFWGAVSRFPRKVAFGLHAPEVPPDVPAVTMDHAQAARDVCEHLLSLGHGKVAVMAGMHPDEESWGRESATHCRHFLELAGAEFVPHYLADRGAEGVVRLFLEEDVTAYYGVTDDEVTHVARLCSERGIRVPQDVSLVGRNDTPWASNSHPPLTTVSMNPDGVARAVVEMLDAGRGPVGTTTVSGRRGPVGTTTVSGRRGPKGRLVRRVRPRLVVRESTGPAKRNAGRRRKGG